MFICSQKIDGIRQGKLFLKSSRYSMLSHAAVPFEEDAQNPQIWFVDHSYMENMFAMFRKVNGMSNAPIFIAGTGDMLKDSDTSVEQTS